MGRGGGGLVESLKAVLYPERKGRGGGGVRGAGQDRGRGTALGWAEGSTRWVYHEARSRRPLSPAPRVVECLDWSAAWRMTKLPGLAPDARAADTTGHFSASDRYKYLREQAYEQAFVLHTLGCTELAPTPPDGLEDPAVPIRSSL